MPLSCFQEFWFPDGLFHNGKEKKIMIVCHTMGFHVL